MSLEYIAPCDAARVGLPRRSRPPPDPHPWACRRRRGDGSLEAFIELDVRK
jgi:hypothetical protein